MPINSKDKGARGEIALAKILSARFSQPFSRSIGSGNRWSQVAALPKHAQETYTGDLVCPVGFGWTIESKVGYDEIDLGSLQASKLLDKLLAQAKEDAARASRKPLLCLRQSRRPWVAFVNATSLPEPFLTNLGHTIGYKDWIGISLEELLTLPDEYWFLDV